MTIQAQDLLADLAARGVAPVALETDSRAVKRGDVFLPREFVDLGGADQVLRAFTRLVDGQAAE